MRENMQQQALLTCTQILESAVLMQSKIRTYVKRLFHMELSLLRKTKVCQELSSHPCEALPQHVSSAVGHAQHSSQAVLP